MVSTVGGGGHAISNVYTPVSGLGNENLWSRSPSSPDSRLTVSGAACPIRVSTYFRESAFECCNREPLSLGSTDLGGNNRPQLPEVTPVLAHDIDKHEVRESGVVVGVFGIAAVAVARARRRHVTENSSRASPLAAAPARNIVHLCVTPRFIKIVQNSPYFECVKVAEPLRIASK